MSEPSAIDAASKRLALALDALAAAVERRHEADRGEQTLDAQLHALGTDRSRLASELDAAAARARTLETTNREVAQRLDAAIDTIRSVLATERALRDVNVRRGRPCRRSMSPSTAASSAWPARTAKRRVCRVWRQDLDASIATAADPFRRDRRHPAHGHGGAHARRPAIGDEGKVAAPRAGAGDVAECERRLGRSYARRRRPRSSPRSMQRPSASRTSPSA